MDYLKLNELKHNHLYLINARNASYGVYDKNKCQFVISRFKFRDNFTFEETHCDASDWFGTVKPIKELELCPYDVEKYNEVEMLNYLNDLDEIKCKECGRGKDEWIRHEEWCSIRKKVF